MTVRLQLDRLAQRGLLYRHRGRGTFVAEPRVAAHRAPHVVHRGHAGPRPRARLATARHRGDPGRSRAWPPGSRSRPARASSASAGYAPPTPSRWPPSRPTCPPGASRGSSARTSTTAASTTSSSTGTPCGSRRPSSASRSPTSPPRRPALLETEPGRPAFRIERTTRDAGRRVIEFASSVYRGDRYEVLMHARRDPQA